MRIDSDAEVEKSTKPDYRAFTRRVIEQCFTDYGGDLDYDAFLEIGLSTGVIREEPYDPDKHGVYPADDLGLDPGEDDDDA